MPFARRRRDPRLRLRRPARGAVALAIVAVLSVAALAAAAALTLGVARVRLNGPSGMRTERIAVTGRGVSVYELTPETTRHLLCASTLCLSIWPPVTVARGTHPRAAGVRGRLGTLRRRGFTQVTLNGHPLYKFAEDGGRRGIATGDGLHSFHGVWHVFRER